MTYYVGSGSLILTKNSDSVGLCVVILGIKTFNASGLVFSFGQKIVLF